MAGLTLQQQRFVDEYLIDLNATAAYKRAGYRATGRSAENNASRLLGHAGVKSAIQAAQAQRAQRCAIDADRVLQELAAVAFSDLGQMVEFTHQGILFRPSAEIPEAARRAMASIKVKRDLGSENRPASETVEFKLWSKVDALKQLAMHLGLLKNTLDVNVKGPPFKTYLGVDTDKV